MGYWKKEHGLYGNNLEEYINLSNNIYLESGLAVIQKIPTPITPVEIDKENGRIKLAYFQKKSTVDYIGNVQGIPVAFDAKETKLDYLPLTNIHPHQIEFMEQFHKQNGMVFLIVRFSHKEETFLLPWEVLKKYWNRSLNGGRKSIPYSAFEKRYLIKRNGNVMLHYLVPLSIYLEESIKNPNQAGKREYYN